MAKKTEPYAGIPSEGWLEKTRELVAAHPMNPEEVFEAVLDSWDRILTTKIAGELKIGDDVEPSPQMVGNLLKPPRVRLITR